MSAPRIIQHDNLDKVPPSGAADREPWARGSHVLFDWRALAVLCGAGLLGCPLAWYLIGADIRAWVQYSWGGTVVAVAIIGGLAFVALFLFKSWALQEQPGGFHVAWWQVRGDDVVRGMLHVEHAFAEREFPHVAQLTLTNPQPAPPALVDAEIVDTGPDIGPLRLDDWMLRLDAEPHAIFAAKTKGGKSTMAKVGLKPRIDAGESIFIIDPHSNGWLDLPSVGGGLNWTEVEDAMSTVTRLYRERMEERERHMRETGHELSQTYFPRLTIIFDEANESRTMIESRYRSKASPWQPFVEIMGSGSRKVGISLWLICQSALIKNLGGSTVMRRNLTVFALDHATITELIEDEELLKTRREAIVQAISGATYPAVTVLNGQAFLLDRTNLHLIQPGSARQCAWDGWDYNARAPRMLRIADRSVVSASVRPSEVARVTISPADLLAEPVADGRTADGQRTRLYLKAMAGAGKTREYARARMAALGMPFENKLWTEVRKELGLSE